METVDDETADAALDFIDRQHQAGKPWFVWWSGTRMHFRTHVKEELRGILADTGWKVYRFIDSGTSSYVVILDKT